MLVSAPVKPLLAPALALFLLAGCGGDDDAEPGADAAGAQADAGAADAGASIDGGAGEDLDMQAADFGCIRDGTQVRSFFVTNPLGHLDEALAVADSKSGGTYPVGTVIQLIPLEAMVKRREGWDPSTGDWEFFSLSVAATETTILQRGGADVQNSFGGNCFECHSMAAPQWDLVCEDSHGCEPLGIPDEVIQSLQDGDTRCLE